MQQEIRDREKGKDASAHPSLSHNPPQSISENGENEERQNRDDGDGEIPA